MEQAKVADVVSALDNPRLLGEALIALANAKEAYGRTMVRYRDAQPYAAIGRAVTTSNRSVSLRTALDIVREMTHVPLIDFCATLRRYGWVKLTPRDNTHRPTKAAIEAGYVERMYYGDNRGYKPAITPTGMEVLKYAFSTGKLNTLEIT